MKIEMAMEKVKCRCCQSEGRERRKKIGTIQWEQKEATKNVTKTSSWFKIGSFFYLLEANVRRWWPRRAIPSRRDDNTGPLRFPPVSVWTNEVTKKQRVEHWMSKKWNVGCWKERFRMWGAYNSRSLLRSSLSGERLRSYLFLQVKKQRWSMILIHAVLGGCRFIQTKDTLVSFSLSYPYLESE